MTEHELKDFTTGAVLYADGRLYIMDLHGIVGLLEPTATGLAVRGRFPLVARRVKDAFAHPVVFRRPAVPALSRYTILLRRQNALSGGRENVNARTISWALSVTILLTGLCAAQVEITPFYGYQFGGSFEDSETGRDYDLADGSCAGGMLNVHVNEISQIEFYFSRQETELESEGPFPTDTFFDLDVDYYHLGGTLLILNDEWQPFVVGTLGATHLSPEPSSIDSLTRFSVGLGGGVRYFPTKNFGLYLAGRGFFTFIDSDSHIVVESGSATVDIVADGLWQAVLQAGLILRF